MESELQVKQRWPLGAQLLMDLACPSTIVIIDNNRGMLRQDRHQLVNCIGAVEVSQCSRWDEMKSVILDMARVSMSASNSLEIRLVNDAQPIVVTHSSAEELARVSALFTIEPQGFYSPLCAQLLEVTGQLLQEKKNKNTMTSLIIMSNGHATDGDVMALLQPLLETLSVRIMVRLCSDESDVIIYWHEIQTQLSTINLSITLLSDHITTAAQVSQYNPWLTYGEPLHRLREFGMNVPPLEYLSTRALSEPEMRYVVNVLVKQSADSSETGGLEDGLKGDLQSFISTIRSIIVTLETTTNTATTTTTTTHAQATEVYCPIRRVYSKWVNLEMVWEIYGNGNNPSTQVPHRGLSPTSSSQPQKNSANNSDNNTDYDQITTAEALQKMIDELQNNDSNNHDDNSNNQSTPTTASLQEIINRLVEKGQKDEQQISTLQQQLALVSNQSADLSRALSTAAQQIAQLETEKTTLLDIHETASGRVSGKDDIDNMSTNSRALSSDISPVPIRGASSNGSVSGTRTDSHPSSQTLSRLKQQVSQLTEENQTLRGKLETLINDQIEVTYHTYPIDIPSDVI